MPDYREQTARPSGGDIGTPMLSVRNDTPADISNGNANLAMTQLDSAGSLRITEEGGKATYFGTSLFACDSTATDIAQFPGVAGVTAKIQGILISAVATARADGNLSIIRRSAANTAGTTGNASVAKADTRDAAASCQPVHYTAHPTALGATAGTLIGQHFIQPAAASDNLLPNIFIDFRQFNGGKPVRVQGATDFLSVNVPAALGGTGNAWAITWIWTEEPTTA
jgi:hypothetical protein